MKETFSLWRNLHSLVEMFRPHFCDWHHSTVSTSSHFCKELDIFTLRELYVGQTGRIVFPYLLKYATYLHYIDHFSPSFFFTHSIWCLFGPWVRQAIITGLIALSPPPLKNLVPLMAPIKKLASRTHSYIDTLCKFCPCASLSLRHKH